MRMKCWYGKCGWKYRRDRLEIMAGFPDADAHSGNARIQRGSAWASACRCITVRHIITRHNTVRHRCITAQTDTDKRS